ncbi:MAG: substrate-binding domain-containing protein [Oceanipulchritudo sp.]
MEMNESYPRIVIDLAEEYGYGLQIARGLRRYRVKRPGWIFMRCATELLHHLEPGSLTGAIGHYFDKAHLQALKQNRVPFYVSVSSRGPSDWWPRIIPDNHAIGRMAAEYFLKKGYRHFGVSDLGKIRFAVERTEGFRERLAEAGITDLSVVRVDDPPPDPARLPMALFAINDARAHSQINRFIDHGIRIPEDVSILGVDDDELVALYSPVPISSVRLPLEQIGFAACELLEAMVNSGKQEYGTYRHAPIGVIERRSTEARAVTDGRVRKALAYMEAHLATLEGIDSLADALHLNRRTLERLFERSIGLSPAALLMQRRAEYAEKLLMETDYTVDHVAELVGFEDRRRLYRAFKKLGRPLPSLIRAGR